MTFWWWSFPLSEGLRPCKDLHTSWSGGIRMLPCISTSRNTIILKRKLIRYSWSQSRGQTSCIFNVLRSECNLSPSKRDFFVLLCCNTQSYRIRGSLVSLSYVWISIKVTLFLSSYMSRLPFCIENQVNRSGYSWFVINVIFNLASQSWKFSFKKFKITVRGVILNWHEWNNFRGLVNLWMRMTSETDPLGI